MDAAELRERYGVTKKEASILDRLMDGQTHSKADIITHALNGQHACRHLVPMHLNRMKPKLRAHGVTVLRIHRDSKFVGWKLRFEQGAS
jgi:hypothetical protein